MKLAKRNKKTYLAERIDYAKYGYIVLFLSLFAYGIVRYITNQKFALPFFLVPSAVIGVLVILVFLPFRVLTFFITEFVVFVYFRNIPKNMPAETVIILGRNDYLEPSFWLAPNCDMDLLFLTKYLQIKGASFSIYQKVTLGVLDRIMSDKDIKTVYLVGHGKRHSFVLDSKTVADYCRYNDKRYQKDFVYQIHCNQGGGKSLVEYVVPQKNQAECLPEDGYLSNVTVSHMFIDKIMEYKGYGKIRATIVNYWFRLLAILISAVVFVGWGYLFFKMVA